MTVEFVPKKKDCYSMGWPNGVFFSIVNTSGVSDIIGRQCTNDPLDVSEADALRCAETLTAWTVPDEKWEYGMCPHEAKQELIDFLLECKGFTTY